MSLAGRALAISAHMLAQVDFVTSQCFTVSVAFLVGVTDTVFHFGLGFYPVVPCAWQNTLS